MMRSPHSRRLRFQPFALSALAGLACLCSTPAFAQFGVSLDPVDTPGLEIEAHVGIDGVIDNSTPMPLSFLIRNDSVQDIEARLVITEPWRGYEHVLGDIFIGAGSTRTFSSIQALPDWYTCMATLEQDGDIHWRRELPMGNSDSRYQSEFHYALFVDPDGRKLRMAGDEGDEGDVTVNADADADAPDDAFIDKELSLQVLNTLPWQVPKHPAALTGVDAVVLSEHTVESDLNLAQWRAIACWICQGGTVFVPSSSDKVLKTLLESAPLRVSRSNRSGGFEQRSVGLGRILTFERPLFSRRTDDRSKSMQREILEAVTEIPDNQLATMIETVGLPYPRDSGTDHNRSLVVALFIVYMMLSGVVSLMLFRLGTRRIVIYTLSVVLITSILAATIGAAIRLSQGNLRWVSVTALGDQGAVQLGRINVQSVGGRSTNISVLGDNVDLQLLDSRYRNWWQNDAQLHPPFTWQPNLNKADQSSYQILAPVTPWGKRLLSSAGYAKDLPNIDIELDFEEATTNGRPSTVQADRPPDGTFVLTVTNHLPYDLDSASVVIGVDDRESGGKAWQMEHSMGTIASATTQEIRFNSEFTARRESRDTYRYRTAPDPRLFFATHSEVVTAYVIGRIAGSPVITIDESNSDFSAAEEMHFVLRQLEADELSPSVTEAFTEALRTAD